MTLVPGTTVGRYQILEPLGQGGMATVYKAFQPSLDRQVAVKVLRPGYAQDAEFRERFEREAKAIARLRHPHIVQVFDFEVAASGEYVLAMEFLEGGTLKDRLVTLAAQSRGLEPRESVRIVAEVAEALEYAHEQGVIHRDVKPSNVMLTRKDWAVVTDFGIARILGATSHTQTGVGIGTPEYMAPEQGQGTAIDHRADIYSLGAMAYELLAGRVPYTADTPLAVVLAHIKDPLPLPSKVNPTIGQGVERALLKALAKDPAQRFETAAAFAEALTAGLAEDSKGGTMPTVVVRGTAAPVAAATPARAAPPAPKQVTLLIPPVLSQRPIVTGIAAAAVLAIVVGGVVAGNAFRAAPAPSLAPTPTAASAAATSAATPITATPPVASALPSVAASFAATKPPKFAVPPKGALIFEAKLDGSGTDVSKPNQVGDPSATAIRQVPGALELEMVKASSFTGNCDVQQCVAATAGFNVPRRPQTYVGELDITVAPGADVVFGWQLWSFRGVSYSVHLTTIGGDGGDGVVSLSCSSPACPSFLVSDPVRVDGLQKGRTFTIAAVVEEQLITLYLDQKLAGKTPASIIAPTTPGIQINGPSDIAGKGLMKIVGARFYELPSASAVQTATASPAAAVAHAVPAKGALLWDARLDGTSIDLPTWTTNPTGSSETKFSAGAIDLLAKPSGSGFGSLNAPTRQTYVGEIDIAGGLSGGTEAGFTWTLLTCGGNGGSLRVFVQLGSETMNLDDWTGPGGGDAHNDLTAQIPIVGISKGKAHTIAAVVSTGRVSLYLDEQRVADVPYSRCVQGGRNIGLASYDTATATTRITGARLYALP